jgi:hypothetical protein
VVVLAIVGWFIWSKRKKAAPEVAQ